jgi:hypothetical protein
MGNTADTVPFPHAFIPVTVRLPEVADREKPAVIDAVFPEGVNPVPE